MDKAASFNELLNIIARADSDERMAAQGGDASISANDYARRAALLRNRSVLLAARIAG